MYKYYLIYLNNDLYGWTIESTYLDMFLNQRNYKKFNIKKKVFEIEIEEQLFMNKYKNLKLIKDILTDERGNDFDVVTTTAETAMLDEFFDTLNRNIIIFKVELPKFKNIIKDKYVDSLTSLLSHIENTASNKTVEVFFYLFKNTL